MNLLSDERFWGPLAGLALVPFLGVAVVVLGLLELLAVLSGGATLLVLVKAAVPYLLGLVVLAVGGVLLALGLAAFLVKQAADGVDSRTVRRLADRARDSDFLRKAGLSRRL